MKLLSLILVGVIILSNFLAIPVYSQEELLLESTGSQTIVISEIQTGGLTAGEEFVEISNLTDQIIDLSNIRLEYASSSGASWQLKRTLEGKLGPYATIYYSYDNYLVSESSGHFSSGLAATGGHIRLIEIDSIEPIDKVGWGSAVSAEGLPAIAPPASSSVSRITDELEFYIDTDNNFNDFVVDLPNPTNFNEFIEPEEDIEEEVIPDETEEDQPDEVVVEEETEVVPEEEILDEGFDYSAVEPLKISELFPDPATPQTDAEHEFVEIFNPNNIDLPLAGVLVQTGATFSYKHTFKDTDVIGANEYIILTSKDTSLSLSNSGGSARILLPDGLVWGEVVTYPEAETGQSYSNILGVWQWTGAVTPGLVNSFSTLTNVKVKKAKATTKKSAKKTTKKATKKSSEIASPAISDDDYSDPAELGVSKPSWAVIASLLVISVIYSVYEYRNDIKYQLWKFGRNRQARSAARS